MNDTEKHFSDLKEQVSSFLKEIKKRNEEIVEQKVATAMWGQSKFFLSFLIVFIAGFGLIINLLINNKDDMITIKETITKIESELKNINKGQNTVKTSSVSN